jgi:hypothetical protein
MKKLKIKNWTNCIQDRKNWKLYAEKVGTFKGLKLWRVEKKKEKKYDVLNVEEGFA